MANIQISWYGILHALLKIQDREDLEGHPKIGASWEGFVLHEIRRIYRAEAEECFFWATHGGAELDLLIMKGQRRFGFEIKRTTSPRLTPSMVSSMESLKLDRLTVIHAGDNAFPLADGVEAIPFARMRELLAPSRSKQVYSSL